MRAAYALDDDDHAIDHQLRALHELLQSPKVAGGSQADELLRSRKAASVAQLVELLRRPNVALGAQLVELLRSPKVASVPQLIELLSRYPRLDAARLAEWLADPASPDVAQLLESIRAPGDGAAGDGAFDTGERQDGGRHDPIPPRHHLALGPAQLPLPDQHRGALRDEPSPARPSEPAGQRRPKQIVQCGNMTGDMFIICAALRLDPSLSVRVIWDRIYYKRVHEQLAKDLSLTVLEVFNRGKPPARQAKTAEQVEDNLAGRMEANAKRIAAFYVSAGIAEQRIRVEESDAERFPGGSYDDEYKAIKERVLPKDGSEGSDTLAVPGYATSTVQRAFKTDRVGAENAIRGMFRSIEQPRRDQIEAFRRGTVGSQRVVLLWSRGSSRSPGGGNTGLDTDPTVLEQLVDLMSGRVALNGGEPLKVPSVMDHTPWIIGDPVPDASPNLKAYVQSHDLTLYWERLEPRLTEVEQMYFLDLLRQHNAACAIGMISGILEVPAVLGMPTAYFELSFMRHKGKRWEKMAGKHKQRPDTGPVPQLNQLEISADQEYSANMREVQNALEHWLTTTRDSGLRADPADPAEARKVIDQVINLGARRGPWQEQPFRFDPDRMQPDARQLGLDHVKHVGAQVAQISRNAPPEFSPEELRWIHHRLTEARQNFALTAEELDSLGSLINAWHNTELRARSRSAMIDQLGGDPDRLVELLRGMAPQAEIRHDGSNITINGTRTMKIAEVEDRLRRDPKWVAKQLRVERARALHADKALVVDTNPQHALEKARRFPGEGVENALQPLLQALGARAFAGLVADLAETPQALGDLLPVVDMGRLAQVATRIGPDAVAGIMVECRGSPGRFVTFINGVLARQSDIEQAGEIEEFDDGGLDGAKVLDSNLALAMHRASLPPDARELVLRPRKPQERSQVIEIQRHMKQDDVMRGTAVGYGRGNGRRMRVGTEYDIGPGTGASVGLRTMPISAEDRQSDTYTALLRQLAALKIRNAGRAQLAELADVFAAASKFASRPRFHTGDLGILDALGEHAGYPMAERHPRESYARFFEARNRANSADDARQSFTCTLGPATVEIVPVEAVKLGKQAPSTSTMALARTVPGSGTRLHDRTRVECTANVTGWTTKPCLIEGTFAGYTVEGRYLVRTEHHGTVTVDPAEYDVQVTEAGTPRVYEGKTIAEVQEMFPKVKGIAEKLQGIAKRTVAKEVEGIERYTVGDYLKIIEGAGFDAFVVGGAVRDIVSGAKDPADIDLATTMPAVDALTAFEGNKLADRQGADRMPHARTIPQHGLTQVEHQVETGLDVVSLHSSEHGVHPMDLETDVANRDFTINALFYDPRRNCVLDPTGRGLADLASNVMRWTCASKGDAASDGDAAIAAKLRNDSYQIGRWIKFRIKGMTPAGENDVAILNTVFAEHVRRGLTPEEKARILDGIGKPLHVALEKADEMGVRRDLLEALGRVD